MEGGQLHSAGVLWSHLKQHLLKGVEITILCVHIILVHLGEEGISGDTSLLKEHPVQILRRYKLYFDPREPCVLLRLILVNNLSKLPRLPGRMISAGKRGLSVKTMYGFRETRLCAKVLRNLCIKLAVCVFEGG